MEYERMIKVQLKRYYHWRYSGPITVIGSFALAFLAWHYITDSIDFYEKFTCPQMLDYYKDTHVRVGLPKYDQLTEEQKAEYESLMKPCVDQGWKKVND